MRLTIDIDDDAREGLHEHLAILYNLVMSKHLFAQLKRSGFDETKAWNVTSAFLWDHAMMFDQHGEFVVNGKTYRPRIAFVDEQGELLPGAAEFDFLHEYAVHEVEELEGDDFTFEP